MFDKLVKNREPSMVLVKYSIRNDINVSYGDRDMIERFIRSLSI